MLRLEYAELLNGLFWQ